MGDSQQRRIRQIVRTLVLLGAVSLVGTIGYSLLEGWPLLDALYMTVITLTTVGYGEVRELDPPGQLFTIVLIMTSVGIVAYSASAVAAMLVETEFRTMLWRRRMDKRIRAIRDHYVVCGYGRTGQAACRTLARHRLAYVVVENHPESVSVLKERGELIVADDAVLDETLHEAGIERARGLVAALGDDASNVYLVLSARQFNPSLQIVSWADSREAETKIRRAGADYVLSPYLLGGARLVQYFVAPHALRFLDLAIQGEYHDFRLDEIRVERGSPLAGHSLKSLRIGREVGVVLIGVARANGEMRFNPPGDFVFQEGDSLIGIGTQEQFGRLRERI